MDKMHAWVESFSLTVAAAKRYAFGLFLKKLMFSVPPHDQPLWIDTAYCKVCIPFLSLSCPTYTVCLCICFDGSFNQFLPEIVEKCCFRGTMILVICVKEFNSKKKYVSRSSSQSRIDSEIAIDNIMPGYYRIYILWCVLICNIAQNRVSQSFWILHWYTTHYVCICTHINVNMCNAQCVSIVLHIQMHTETVNYLCTCLIVCVCST